jgi:hypothetical protein
LLYICTHEEIKVVTARVIQDIVSQP